MSKSISARILAPSAMLAITAAAHAAIPVIQEDFQDDVAGSWQAYGGAPPSNVGHPGQWMNSGHVPVTNPYHTTPDLDWRPQVQNNALTVLPTPPTGAYIGSLNRRPTPSDPFGVFNMDGILKFTLANGTARPAVTGDKIVGSFDWTQQNGNFGFGFTDNISALQSYQASLFPWTGTKSAPIMMPTAYSDIEPDQDGQSHRDPFSSNVTAEISFNGGFNNLYTHAVVDTAENNGAGDGFVDQGNSAPRTDPLSTAHRPLPSGKQRIRFEYTVGNANYDLLQVDQDVTDGVDNYVDILQGPTNNPTPNGPMPVGKVMSSIEGLFITGCTGQLTEVWYDNINVSIVPGGVVANIMGDANHDGTVNTLDFTELANHFNQTTTLVWANGDVTADFNGDGIINALDFNAISTNFGATAGQALGSVVPEPASLGVLGIMSLVAVRRRHD